MDRTFDPARYRWIDNIGVDSAATIAGITGPVSEADVLTAHHVDPASRFDHIAESLWELDETEGGNRFVQLWPEDDRLVVVEENGWTGNHAEVARRLSRGGRYAAWYFGVKNEAFLYAVDGEIVFEHDDLVFDWQQDGAALGAVGLPHFPAASAGEEIELFGEMRSIALALLDYVVGVSFPTEASLWRTPRPTYRRLPG